MIYFRLQLRHKEWRRLVKKYQRKKRRRAERTQQQSQIEDDNEQSGICTPNDIKLA